MFGKGRGFDSQTAKTAIEALEKKYETLIFDYSLDPGLIESFRDRLRHARNSGRDPERFIDEEIQEFQKIQSDAKRKEETEANRLEVRRRRLAGETTADRVLDEYRRRIEHYPDFAIHPDASQEVAKLYGAVATLDASHWSTIETFLRKVYPSSAQVDRVSIEHRYWRFIPTRKDRLPEELERYRHILAAPSATKSEKVKEAQEAIKTVAVFLHDLLDVCERAAVRHGTLDERTDAALQFVRNLISDFRLKELKRR